MNFPNALLSLLFALLLQSLMLSSAHGQVRIQGSAAEYPTISAAVGASAANDVIEVDSGVYYESGITISHPLQIRAVQIISNQPQVTIDASGMGRHFLVQSDCTLEGLRLRNGDVSGTGDGGAILHDSGALVLTDCIVESSSANSGGGIAANSGTLTLVRSLFLSCDASIEGGGIHVGGASSQSQPTGTFDSGQALGNSRSTQSRSATSTATATSMPWSERRPAQHRLDQRRKRHLHQLRSGTRERLQLLSRSRRPRR